jgi:chromate transporter
MNQTQSVLERGRLSEIARAFLHLGFFAFGGAVAHIAMMEAEFVRRRGWLSKEEFVDRVGAVNLLPGPSSTEMVIYLGFLRGGAPGLIIAGASFILPSALMMCGMAWAYVRFGTLPQIAGLLGGVKPVVVVLIAQAVWSLAKTALKSLELAAIAIIVVALAALRVSTLPLLIGTGVAWIAANRFAAKAQAHSAGQGAATGTAAVGGVTTAVTVSAASVMFYFLKIGALLWGSGYVLLAVLREDLVSKMHWLSEAQLIDAVAVSQATPGPFFTVATFIGFLLHGWRGAGLATLAMFLPAFLYVAATARVLVRLRQSPQASIFLDGVNAAAVALMAFVGFEFAREAVVTPLAAAIAAFAALLVFRYKVNSAWVVLAGAVCGLAARLAGIS